MDKPEKRRLKKLGKEIVEKRSDNLKKALNEANPARILYDGPKTEQQSCQVQVSSPLRKLRLSAAPLQELEWLLFAS
jgi:hypothetical protein